MKVDNLRAFIAVANTENMTKAAEQLFMSQQNLSLMVKRMEDELGVSLFERDGKRISLSEQGKDFFEVADKMLTLYDGFLDRNKPANEELFVNFYTTPSLASYFVSMQARLNAKSIYMSINRMNYYELIEHCEKNTPGFFLISAYVEAPLPHTLNGKALCERKNEKTYTICHAQSDIAKSGNRSEAYLNQFDVVYNTYFIDLQEYQNRKAFFSDDINQTKDILKKKNYIYNLPALSYETFFNESDEWVILDEKTNQLDYKIFYNSSDTENDAKYALKVVAAIRSVLEKSQISSG